MGVEESTDGRTHPGAQRCTTRHAHYRDRDAAAPPALTPVLETYRSSLRLVMYSSVECIWSDRICIIRQSPTIVLSVVTRGAM